MELWYLLWVIFKNSERHSYPNPISPSTPWDKSKKYQKLLENLQVFILNYCKNVTPCISKFYGIRDHYIGWLKVGGPVCNIKSHLVCLNLFLLLLYIANVLKCIKCIMILMNSKQQGEKNKEFEPESES